MAKKGKIYASLVNARGVRPEKETWRLLLRDRTARKRKCDPWYWPGASNSACPGLSFALIQSLLSREYWTQTLMECRRCFPSDARQWRRVVCLPYFHCCPLPSMPPSRCRSTVYKFTKMWLVQNRNRAHLFTEVDIALQDAAKSRSCLDYVLTPLQLWSLWHVALLLSHLLTFEAMLSILHQFLIPQDFVRWYSSVNMDSVLDSLSWRMSYRQTSWSLEATRLIFRLFELL